MLSYKLSRLAEKIEAQFALRLAPFGITLPMYRVLIVLARNPGPHTLNSISRTIGVELSTLSRQITTMTKLGLVTRDRTSENGRIVQIDITARGREIALQLTPFTEQFDSLSKLNLDNRQLEEFHKILEIVEQNIEEIPRSGT
jgi:Transcriptional regulators